MDATATESTTTTLLFAALIRVKCRYCDRYHCDAAAGSRIRWRCRKCKMINTVTVGN